MSSGFRIPRIQGEGKRETRGSCLIVLGEYDTLRLLKINMMNLESFQDLTKKFTLEASLLDIVGKVNTFLKPHAAFTHLFEMGSSILALFDSFLHIAST